MNGVTEGVGAILAGLAVVITAVGSILQQRGKQKKIDFKSTTKDLKLANIKLRAYERHMVVLENKIVSNRMDLPERPIEADLMYGMEDSEEDDTKDDK